jgi:hypothetical protein
MTYRFAHTRLAHWVMAVLNEGATKGILITTAGYDPDYYELREENHLP